MAEKKAKIGSLKADMKATQNLPLGRKVFLLVLGIAVILGFCLSLYCTVFSIEKYYRSMPAYLVLCFATVISYLFIIYYCLGGYRKSAKIFIVPIFSVLITIGTFVFLNAEYPVYFWSYLACGVLFLLAFLFSKNLKIVVTLLFLSFLLSVAISIQCSVLIPSGYPGMSVLAAICAYGFQGLLSLLILSILTCVVENLRRNFEAREGEKGVPRGDGKYWKFK